MAPTTDIQNASDSVDWTTVNHLGGRGTTAGGERGLDLLASAERHGRSGGSRGSKEVSAGQHMD